MRFSVASFLVLAVAAGCASSPRPAPERRAPAPVTVQLRTWVSVSEEPSGARPASHADATAGEAPRDMSAEERLREQMELARALALLADAKFLATAEGRVPFAVNKEPWKDRPVIELSLDEVRIVPGADGGRVKLRLGLTADLPEAGIALDRELVYERPLPVPEADPVRALGPAVEEAAALAASWLVEAAAPEPPPAPEPPVP
jgi:hypothetical protein